MTINNTERIPRMRTAAKIVAELRAMDPNSEVSEHYIRQLVKKGIVPVTWAGSKALINLDDILALLRGGTIRDREERVSVGGIRRVDAKNPQ